jgi:hypothetical protein
MLKQKCRIVEIIQRYRAINQNRSSTASFFEPSRYVISRISGAGKEKKNRKRNEKKRRKRDVILSACESRSRVHHTNDPTRFSRPDFTRYQQSARKTRIIER